jgi:membrane fusion protein (multidrug efflux system)
MKRRTGIVLAAAGVLALAAAAWWLWLRPAPPPAAAQAPPAPEVGVAAVVAADVPLPLDFSGRVAGFRVVEIRSQVNGLLLKREFLEGAVVEQGQVLFRIDPRTYEAALSRAEAQAAQAKATLVQAEENYSRVQGLTAQKVSTQKSLEDAVAARDQARAAILSTAADIEMAKLNLEFTVIKAPVKGPTSLVSPPEGTLIKSQDTLLTTITQTEPAYVNFTFTDSELRSLNEIDKSAEELFDPDKVKVELQFGDGSTYPEPGKVDTHSRTVDARTGTILTRAIFPNRAGTLLPGQFVRVKMTGLTLPNAIVVPKAALNQGPLGAFVYVVEPDNVARVRQVRLYRELDSGWIVRKGLNAGETVVVDGVIRVRPGNPVRPVPMAPASAAPAASAKP